MSGLPPRPLLRRVPVGAWVMAVLSLSIFNALRSYSHVPGMPTGLPAPPMWARLLIGAAVPVALAGGWLLRRVPLAGLALIAAGSVAILAGMSTVRHRPEVDALGFLIAVDIAFGYVVASRPPWQWIAALPMATAGWLVPGAGGTGWSYVVSWALLPAAVAGLIGYSVRQARRYSRRLTAHAAGEAVTAERLRISRELHDTVAHSVGVIALQAGAAARVVDTQPEQARAAMAAVEAISRQTLSGLRRVVGALREPPAGLAGLDDLAATTAAAGVRVELRRRGEQRVLPPEIDLSAYRIIQESLANVIRHAGTGSCEVLVDDRGDELAIEVSDRGRGAEACGDSAGYGLAGMRERVALLRGSFAAGPRAGGGFQVTARLPVPG